MRWIKLRHLYTLYLDCVTIFGRHMKRACGWKKWQCNIKFIDVERCLWHCWVRKSSLWNSICSTILLKQMMHFPQTGICPDMCTCARCYFCLCRKKSWVLYLSNIKSISQVVKSNIKNEEGFSPLILIKR